MEAIKHRDSNMELLRLVAMLCIIVMHLSYLFTGNYRGTPLQEGRPLLSIANVFIVCTCYGRVLVFVLLSGWYGIHPKKKSFASLIFQVWFLSLLSYAVFIAVDKDVKFTWNFLIHVFLTDDYWFVPVYIVLYFFAPVLNIFAEKASKRQFVIVLIVAIVMQSIFGWLSPRELGFKNGASPFSFFILYLLARYVRLHATCLLDMSKERCLAWLLAIITVNAAIDFYGYYTHNNALIDVMFKLSSPFVIASGMFILLFFSKLKMTYSPRVNRFAKSCFAVFLIHCFPFFMSDVFYPVGRYLYENYSGAVFALLNIGFVAVIYIGSILVDQVRIAAWSTLSRRIKW